jgi:hypothetical protein
MELLLRLPAILFGAVHLASCGNGIRPATETPVAPSAPGVEKYEVVAAKLVVELLKKQASAVSISLKDGEVAGPKFYENAFGEKYLIYCVRYKAKNNFFNSEYQEFEKTVNFYVINGKTRASTRSGSWSSESECKDLNFQPVPEFVNAAKVARIGP